LCKPIILPSYQNFIDLICIPFAILHFAAPICSEMLPKTSLLFITCLFAFFGLQAQKSVTLSGKLVDTLSVEPLGYATVSLQDANSKALITGQIADEKGDFKFEALGNERFFIKIEHVGYQTKYVEVNLESTYAQLDLGAIQLAPLSQLLETVTIQGQKKNVIATLEKQVFKTEQFETAKGGTAIDVLRNIPSVSVNAEGEIMVRGSKGFLILVNGKPSQLDAATLLGQIPANTIDKIEMITAPSAKYDADGKSGIINIVTKTGTGDGFSFVSNAQIGFPRIRTYENLNEPQRRGLDAILTYRRKAFFSSFSANYLRNDIAGQRIGDVSTTINNILTRFPSDGERSHQRENYGLRALASFKPTPASEISSGFYHGSRTQYRRADIFYTNTKTDLTTNTLRSSNQYFNPNLVKKQGTFNVFNLDYSHTFGNQSQLQVSGLYENAVIEGWTQNANLNPQNYRDTIQYTLNNGRNPLHAFRFKVDFERKLGIGKWSTGYQYRTQQQNGVFDYQEKQGTGLPLVLNPEFTASIEVLNRIHALYTQYAGTYKKVNFSTGLRYENAIRTFEDNKGNPPQILRLSNFFPSASFQVDLGHNYKGKLAYSRRVQRSTNNELNPYPEREHSETLEQGDPNILPEFIGIYELGISKDFKKGNLYWNVYTQQITNIVNRVNRVFNDTILNRIYTNAGKAELWGSEAGLSIAPLKKLTIFLGGNLYNLNIRGTLFNNQVEVNSRGWVYSVNSNISWQILKTLDAQFNLAYLSARKTAQGEDSRFYQPSCAFKKSFFKKQFTATLQWQNMSVGKMGVNEQRITTFGRDFFTSTNYIQENNIFLLNLSYSFRPSERKSKLPASEFGEREY
jgi:ferric enterobactin receptor